MKKFKTVAAVALTGAMLMGLTACGKGNQAKKFYDHVLKDYDYEEYTVKKYNKLVEDKKAKNEAMEDGILVHVEADEMDKFWKDKDSNSSFDAVETFFTKDDADSDDVRELTYYVKGENSDDNKEIVTLMVANFNSADLATEAFENTVDRTTDGLDIKTKELSEDEYKLSGSSGHLLINLDTDTFVEAVISKYEEAYQQEFDKDMLKEMKKSFKDEFGDLNCYFLTFLDGDCIISVCGMTISDDYDLVEDFIKEFKLGDPLNVELSDELHDAVVDNFIEKID